MKHPLLFVLTLFSYFPVLSQVDDHEKNRNAEIYLNDTKSHYVRFTGLAQVWLRHTDMNPGSVIYGNPTSDYTDISIRRLRFQVIAQLTDRVFFYSQFGMNNFNYHSEKFAGAFFHDAIVEYKVMERKLYAGGGLTAWGGATRNSFPSIGSLMTLDAPLYQQSTNGVNDQFVRKLSVYIKGQLGKLDYRLALSQPMRVIGSTDNVTAPADQNFSFASTIARKQAHGYFKYMFLDTESNLTPYEAGTYLGEKSVFNVGAGFIHQPEATWALDGQGNTIMDDMTIFGIDAFLDKPITENGALTVYAAYTSTMYGDGFVRYVGVNNAATGGTLSAINGSHGNAFPMHGNGDTFYAQAGYLFGRNILLENGKILPFAALQLSEYDRLDESMAVYELGLNFLIHGTHNGKISLMYQNRPVFASQGNDLVLDTRKGMTVLQIQAGF